MYAKGHNGQLEFDGQAVTITRKGLIAMGTVGGGRTRIPLASVTAIDYKPFSIFRWGYLRVVLHGGGMRRKKAIQDEQTVTFSRRQQREFEEIRDAIEAALEGRVNR
jgi:hypothetical protein